MTIPSWQDEKDDKISELPDAILQEILSLIDIRLAVQTCVLSKRWKSLWTCLPNLDFDFDSCKKKPHECDFVDKFLSRRDDCSTISRFRLSIKENVEEGCIKKWLEYAAYHNVEDLDLASFNQHIPIEFPQPFFTSKSLQFLRLKQVSDSVIIPKKLQLPNLKTLHLESFSFEDNNDCFSFSKEPFSNLPNLEELTLKNCELSGLIISNPNLRGLEISFRKYHRRFSSVCRMGYVSAPRLRSFKFEGQVSLVSAMEEFPYLEKVYVDLYPILLDPYTDDIKYMMPLNLIGMFDRLRFAKFVTLSLATIEVLEMNPYSLAKSSSSFCNLKHLKVVKAGRHFRRIVLPEDVMAYLTKGSSKPDQILIQCTETD